MSLKREYEDKGWREVENGTFGIWAAEKFYAAPGATSSVLRVEATSSKLLNFAVALRESQLGEAASGPVADVTLPGGVTLTTAEHAGGLLAGNLPAEPVPTVAIEDFEGVPNEEPEAEEVDATPAAEATDADPTAASSEAPETAADSESGSAPTPESPADASPESPSNDTPVTPSEAPEPPATV